MKLNALTESHDSRIAYHITTQDALHSILKYGLRSGNAARYGKVGDGVYIFFSNEDKVFSQARDLAEYIAVENPVLVRTTVNVDNLLMDEDSLADNTTLEGIEAGDKRVINSLPAGVAVELLNAVIDTEDKSDERLIALEFINKYKIKPSKYIKTYMGHYSFDTARCVSKILHVDMVWKTDENHEWIVVNQGVNS